MVLGQILSRYSKAKYPRTHLLKSLKNAQRTKTYGCAAEHPKIGCCSSFLTSLLINTHLNTLRTLKIDQQLKLVREINGFGQVNMRKLMSFCPIYSRVAYLNITEIKHSRHCSH